MVISTSKQETESTAKQFKHPIRVLVCDDVAPVRMGLRMALELEQDFEVVGEAADGQEAIDLAARLAPDLVLMDLRMPRMDGLAAAEEIVAHGLARAVVILTIYDDPRVRQQAEAVGVTDFLDKASGTTDLFATARRAVYAGN